jgi:hypothetical protein
MSMTACTHASVVTSPTAVAPAVEQIPVRSEQQARVPDEYLVTLAPGVDESIIAEYYAVFGIKYMHVLEEETYLLILANDPGPQKMEDLIYDDARVKAVQPNLIYWEYRFTKDTK